MLSINTKGRRKQRNSVLKQNSSYSLLSAAISAGSLSGCGKVGRRHCHNWSRRSLLGQDASGCTYSCKQDVRWAIPGHCHQPAGNSPRHTPKCSYSPQQSGCLHTANWEGYPACAKSAWASLGNVLDGGSHRPRGDPRPAAPWQKG